MSKKVSEQLKKDENVHIIRDVELRYLNDLDTVHRSFDFYFNQLKTNYLHQIALRLGYNADDQFEFNIDLKAKTPQLTIKKVKL